MRDVIKRYWFLSLLALAMALLYPAPAISYAPEIKSGKLPGVAHDTAISLMRTGDYAGAIEVETEAIEKDQSDTTAHLILTIAYLSINDEKKAARQIALAKRYVPDFVGELNAAAGKFYMLNGRNHRALKHLKESLYYRNDPEVTKLVASIYLNQGQSKKALRYFYLAMDQSPDYAGMARAYLALRNYQLALDFAKRHIAENGSSPDAHLLLGSSYLYLGDLKLARANFEQLRSISPEFYLVWHFIGMIDLIEGKYENAAKAFTEVLKYSPELKESHLCLAVARHLTGDLGGAEQAALSADEDDPVSSIVLAGIYMSQKRRYEAVDEYAKAGFVFQEFALKGFDPSIYFTRYGHESDAELGLVCLLYKSGLFHASESIAQDTEMDSHNPFISIIKARSEAKVGKTFSAKRSYERISTQHVGLITPSLDLSELSEQNGEIGRAIRLAYRAVAIRSESIEARLRLARLLAKSGDRYKAIGVYNGILEREPENLSARMEVALAYADTNNLSSALKHADAALDISPDDAAAQDVFAHVHYRLGNLCVAGAVYDSMETIDSPAVLYHKALVYLGLGKRSNAVAMLEGALDQSDEFNGASSAEAILARLNAS